MTTNPAPSPTTWPLWVIGFVALVGLGWYFSGHESSQLAERQAAPATQTSATVGSRTPDIVTAAELKSELSASVSTVRIAILGMTNPASANAALPQLQQAAARLDRVNVLAEELPAGSETRHRQRDRADGDTAQPALRQGPVET